MKIQNSTAYEMFNCNYMLVLEANGDINIIKDNYECVPTIVYHKSYNAGEKLEDNLMEAFKEWNRLSSKEIKK